MSLRVTQVALCQVCPFSLLRGDPLHERTTFNGSLAQGHVGHFQVETIVDRAATHISVDVFV